jgi:hypothetical protein
MRLVTANDHSPDSTEKCGSGSGLRFELEQFDESDVPELVGARAIFD